MQEKTIAAISTPPGEGGIGTVRISGESAISVSDKVFRSASGKKLSEIGGYTALYGKIYSENELIDEAVALIFRAPKSYTGEDVVEISVHGGSFPLKETLRAVLSAGAEPAAPGEFTKRAYLNGKLDLIEAEAVMSIISADSKASSKAALSLHSGAAKKNIEKIRSSLLTTAAGLSVFSDYPDDELPEFSPDSLLTSLGSARKELENLLRTYDAGKIMREGINAVIAGRPNVGKSTLMNLLSGCRKSIVTPIAGTTRDVVEEDIILGNIKLHLSDTAGLRYTKDEVEKIGVEISREKLKVAGLVLAVFDRSQKENEEDIRLIEICRSQPSLAIVNKSDLDSLFNEELLKGIPTVTVCANNTQAIDEITAEIEKICKTDRLQGNETVLCSERQRNQCERCLKYINEAINVLTSGFTLDAVGVCIDDALSCLLELTGERVTNAVVDEVFSKFCVGK